MPPELKHLKYIKIEVVCYCPTPITWPCLIRAYYLFNTGSVSAACVANQRAQAADVGDQSAQSTDTLIAKSNISLRSDVKYSNFSNCAKSPYVQMTFSWTWDRYLCYLSNKRINNEKKRKDRKRNLCFLFFRKEKRREDNVFLCSFVKLDRLDWVYIWNSWCWPCNEEVIHLLVPGYEP